MKVFHLSVGSVTLAGESVTLVGISVTPVEVSVILAGVAAKRSRWLP